LGGESGGGGSGGGGVEQDGDVCCRSSPQLSLVSVAVDVADADGVGAMPVGKSLWWQKWGWGLRWGWC
jgi:hypothetical protein